MAIRAAQAGRKYTPTVSASLLNASSRVLSIVLFIYSFIFFTFIILLFIYFLHFKFFGCADSMGMVPYRVTVQNAQKYPFEVPLEIRKFILIFLAR
jgi:hypothetical protein